MTQNSQYYKNIKLIVYIIIFIILITFPIIKINHAINDKFENKVLAKFPSVKTDKSKINYEFSNQFEDYLRDRFTFKKHIVTFASYVINTINNINNKFNNTFENSTAFVGQNNWMFYKPKSGEKNYANIPISEIKEKFIYTKLKFLKSYLNKQGIKIYFLIGPDKNRIYKEYYKKNIKITYKEDNLEQLVKFLRHKGLNNIIYPRKEILNYKKISKDILYFKGDTHWDELGAYIGYKALMKRVKIDFRNIKVIDKNNYTIEHSKKYREGDIAWMLKLTKKKFKDINYPEFKFKDPIKIQDLNEHTGFFSHKKSINNSVNNKLKVLMFRDSYTQALKPFISRTFHNVEYIWDGNVLKFKKDINRMKPDIVIVEIVGRLWQYTNFW